jgi:hypothetical protein
MIVLSALQQAQHLRRIKMTKQKGPDSVRARGIAKEKIVPVANGSLQPRAPGWVAPGGANVQSANIEQQGAALRARGSLQGNGIGDQNVGTQRGGSNAQQAGARRGRPPERLAPVGLRRHGTEAGQRIGTDAERSETVRLYEQEE